MIVVIDDGEREVVKLLVEKGVDVNGISFDVWMFLMEVIDEGYKDIV